MDDQNIILFQDYLDQKLTLEEKKTFEQRLQADPEFESDFELYQEVNDVVSHLHSEERNEFKEALSRASSTFFEKPANDKETKVIRFKPWQYSVAASIALLIGFFIFHNSSNPSLNDYVFSDTITLTERGSENLHKLAETSFNKGTYSEAITHFKSLLAEDPNNAEYQFYMAVAHDNLQQFDAASILFTNLIKGSSAYKYKATFYAAISQWRQDNIAQAKRYLESIPDGASEYKVARKLLKKL